ncbi:uncharacterized protein FOMMEDRAFT_152387 [Fomitiporia mediterranea MF3/22]|uniref:uncharacterized protein n=1 Tax=Fomitiporia mediterranea (strain MF3/22) TaxID=694068 RepID=UPI0004407CE0|nr:uncharacterized protein FOMMEDRAFT_152387 [Fomitiporia mediterranea MF3/22]EJD07042.1 hypothetical protein FOMMEDRAFT_152387 [Fomitiporia mediterranea MF3/22]
MAVDDTLKPARVRGLLFIAGIFLVLLQAGLYAGHRQAVAPLQSTVQIKPGSTITEHPIPRLMTQAEDKFRNLLKRQSKTLSEAVAEYRRRYGRDPPKGFDEWFKFAMEKGVKIIDDYDAITEDLLPFMSLSGEELRRKVDQVSHLPSIDMVRLYNGTVKAMNMQQNRWQDEEVSSRANGFRRMIEMETGYLPDMDFPINSKAEGRILIPWEHKQYPELSVQDTSGGIGAARKLFSSIKTLAQAPRAVNFLGYVNGKPPASASENLTFAESVDDKYDFCENPSQHYQQRHFFSDWRTISVLYPVFSPVKTQGYADIRIPISWDNKKDVIFWRGATTGGGNSPSGFAAQYQRHRFVRMTSSHSDENRTVVFPAPDASSYISASVPIKKLNEELAVPLSEHWRYKYLVDVDGMGHSGRFFSFLASDSVAIKATVYQEYFSDWLQPWLHYIPLSQTYEELYNIFAFFSGPMQSMREASNSSLPDSRERYDDGQRRLRRIARAGKHWKITIGRPVDMEGKFSFISFFCVNRAMSFPRVARESRPSLLMTPICDLSVASLHISPGSRMGEAVGTNLRFGCVPRQMTAITRVPRALSSQAQSSKNGFLCASSSSSRETESI